MSPLALFIITSLWPSRLDKGLAAKVEEGKLNFKEARSIADITDHARQRALAKPFMNGSLSSVYVESLIKLAKKEHDTPVEELIRRVVGAEDKEASTTSVATKIGSWAGCCQYRHGGDAGERAVADRGAAGGVGG